MTAEGATLKLRFFSWLCAAVCLAAPPAGAADAVTDAMQAAYVPYRAALFRTNSKAQPEAEQAIAQAQQAWKAIAERYGSKPPAPYERDGQFAATMAQVAAVYERAAKEAGARQLAEAHETLEQVRDLMAELRRRNDVVIHSDAMNAYHAEMEHLLGDGAKLLAAPQGPMLLMARVGALDYLAGRLRSEAPAALLRDADFSAHLQAVEASVSALRAAVLAGDAAAVRDAIGKLKGPYSRMFMKYG
jgi:hypothetical protein